MKKELYDKLSDYIENMDDYRNEIELTEKFFQDKEIDENKLDEVYWNHLLTLLDRVDTKTQNELEVEELTDISHEAKSLTDEYVKHIQNYREFTLTPFESMLLTIYSQKFLEKGGN